MSETLQIIFSPPILDNIILKFEKIERKVTESQKIKNKLAEIWTFWISGAQFPIFYSFIPHSQNMKKPHFPSTQKAQISLQAC